MALVLLVRHGQASFGADDYDVLSETGWEQARRLGRHLAAEGVRPAVVLRGGMRRHRETVEGLLDGLGDGPGDVRVDDRWNEFDHLGVVAAHPDLAQGGTSGLDRREFQRVFVESTRRWAHDEAGSAAYPESFGDFLDRARGALDDACALAGSTGAPVVAVTSGGPVGALCAGLVDPGADRPATARTWERFNTVCVNSSVSRVVIGAGGARLLSFNEHGHLDRSLTTYR